MSSEVVGHCRYRVERAIPLYWLTASNVTPEYPCVQSKWSVDSIAHSRVRWTRGSFAGVTRNLAYHVLVSIGNERTDNQSGESGDAHRDQEREM